MLDVGESGGGTELPLALLPACAGEVLARLPVLSPGYFLGRISETRALLAAEGDTSSPRLTHSQESGERLGTGPWQHKFA